MLVYSGTGHMYRAIGTCGGGKQCVFLVFSFSSSFQSFGGSGGGGGSKSCGLLMIINF